MTGEEALSVMNLSTADLERELTFEGIAAFLRISDPDDQRPQEDARLDIPGDLGDTVTAFSNTYGGLIALGVKERKFKGLNIPDSVVGLGEGQEAIKGKPAGDR